MSFDSGFMSRGDLRTKPGFQPQINRNNGAALKVAAETRL